MDKIKQQKFKIHLTRTKRVFAIEERSISQILRTEFLDIGNMPVLHYGSLQSDHSSTVVKIIEETYNKVSHSILKSYTSIDGLQVIINDALNSLKELKSKLEEKKDSTHPFKPKALKDKVTANILGDPKKNTPPHASQVLEECKNGLLEMIKGLIELGIDQVEKLNPTKLDEIISQIRDNIKNMQSQIESDNQNALRLYSDSSNNLIRLQEDLMKLQFKNKIASWTLIPLAPAAKIDPDLQKYITKLYNAKKILDTEQKLIDIETQKLEYWSHWYKNESEINSRISDLKEKGNIMSVGLDDLIDELNGYKTSGEAIETDLKSLVKKKEDLRDKLKAHITKMTDFFDPKDKKIDEDISEDFGSLSEIFTNLSGQLKNLDFDNEFIQSSKDMILAKTDYLSYKVLIPFKKAFEQSEFNSKLLDKLIVNSDYKPALKENQTLDSLKADIETLKKAIQSTQEKYDEALNRFNRRKKFQS